MFGKTEKTYENFKDVMFLDAFFRPDEKITCKFGKILCQLLEISLGLRGIR